MNQILIVIPESAAAWSSRQIVLPPSVVSSAKLCRFSIASWRRFRPSCQATAFAASRPRLGLRSISFSVSSSGLK
jgi:hypothetical protein